MVFLLFFLIPIIVALGAFFFSQKKITVKEFLIQTVIQGIIAFSISVAIYNSNTSDVEVLHGQVTSKQSVHVSCSHSYRCNCYTTCSGSGSNQTCTEHCSTCYDHSYDVDWMVYSQIGSLDIDRVDRQGLDEPPRFTKTKIGEPFSQTRSFENFIKGSPDTLFKRQGLVEKYKDKIPKYFADIYDYYRIDRVINLVPLKQNGLATKSVEEMKNLAKDVSKNNPQLNNSKTQLGKALKEFQDPNSQVNKLGGQVDQLLSSLANKKIPQNKELNKMVAELNKVIGPKHTGSLGLVIIPSSLPREYYYALEESWLGGKKNDIIPVIALNEDGSISWVEVMGWVKDPLFKVKLRDDLLELNGIGNLEKLSEVILSNVSKYYVRKPIKDFEYLKSSIKPSTTQFILGLVLALIASIITSVIFYKTDVFEDEQRYGRF